MVTLTRLNGSVFALNADLIERVDQTPDTVITLLNGSKYLVRESIPEVVAAVRRFRGSLLAAAADVETGADLEDDDQHEGSAEILRLPLGEA